MVKNRSRNNSISLAILEVLSESPTPLKALPINFKVNEKIKGIVSLNSIKTELKNLAREKKIIIETKANSTYYWVKKHK